MNPLKNFQRVQRTDLSHMVQQQWPMSLWRTAAVGPSIKFLVCVQNFAETEFFDWFCGWRFTRVFGMKWLTRLGNQDVLNYKPNKRKCWFCCAVEMCHNNKIMRDTHNWHCETSDRGCAEAELKTKTNKHTKKGLTYTLDLVVSLKIIEQEKVWRNLSTTSLTFLIRSVFAPGFQLLTLLMDILSLTLKIQYSVKNAGPWADPLVPGCLYSSDQTWGRGGEGRFLQTIQFVPKAKKYFKCTHL